MHHVALEDFTDAQAAHLGFPFGESSSETTRRFRDLEGAVVQFDGARVRALGGTREFRGGCGLAVGVTVVESGHAVGCAQSQSGRARQARLVAVAEAYDDSQGDQYEHDERQDDEGVHDPGIPLRSDTVAGGSSAMLF